MSTPVPGTNPLVVSHLILRRCIGLIGFFLPFVLAVGLPIVCREDVCREMQGSISRYYHTAMGDVFVGALCAVGVFLFAYKGYGWGESAAGILAGAAAIGTALFPMSLESATSRQMLAGKAHIVFAGLFFLSLAYIALRLFPRPDPDSPPVPGKASRNRLYRACGVAILLALALIVVYGALPQSMQADLESWAPVFWLEALAIVAFGIAWLTKGRSLHALGQLGSRLFSRRRRGGGL